MKFKKKLPSNITIKFTKEKGVFGQCRHEEFYNGIELFTIEINAAECITLGGHVIKETIIHELAHILMHVNGYGFYTHNHNFKNAENYISKHYQKQTQQLLELLFS